MTGHRTAATEPADRHEVLLALRNRKMAESAHSFVRGNTARFYDWLGEPGQADLPEGPPVWICGDCHIGNLGPIASKHGQLEIQIRDLDQTVIGNPAHDLIRLGLSLAMAARAADLPGITTAHMLEHLVEGYEEALLPEEGEPGRHGELRHAPEAVRRLMRRAARRSWKHLAEERIKHVEPTIPLGKRFWPLAVEETEALRRLFQAEELRALAVALRTRDDRARIEVVDAAYWRKGCSSLGNLRFAVLVAIREPGEGRPAYCLMDVKEAAGPVTPHRRGAPMPQDAGQRVVAGARQLSPFLGDRIVAGHLLGRPVFVRELMPQDLKLEIDRLGQAEATAVARFLAAVVGRAHARQMDAASRRQWHAELQRRRSTTLDAPSWLWRSVVALVASHEAAYLEHCRRWATQ